MLNCLFEDYHQSIWGRIFYGVFMIRRIVYAGSIVFLRGKSVIQVALFILTQIAVLVYSVKGRPYLNALQNAINIANEAFITLIGFILIGFSDFSSTAKNSVPLGYVVFALIILQVVTNWVLMLAEIVPKVY